MARYHELHRAADALGRRMEGGLRDHLPRPASREWTRSQNLRHLARSMFMLAYSSGGPEVMLTSSLMANRLLLAVGRHMYATKQTSAR